MAAPKRNPTQRENDLVTIANLYLRGQTQAAIAQKLGVTRQQIGYDLNVLRERWKASSLVDINEAKSRELARIDHLEIEYWEAWDKSREASQKQRASKRSAGTATHDFAVIETASQVGDPRFLAGVQWCIEKRCKIFGVDAPTKIAPTDPTGQHEFTGFTDDDRIARLASIFEKARDRRDRQITEGNDPEVPADGPSDGAVRE